MSVINAVAQLLAAGGDYLISRSVRLRSSASAYLSKTFGTAGNRKKWTYSLWIKRGALNTYGGLIASKVDGNNYSSLEFSGDELRFVQASGGSITVNKKPAGVFRDPSAWYHIVAAMDTDNATAEDRFILYKNGERVTVWAANTPPALGLATGYINSTTAQWIGLDANPLYFDGLIADVNFIDGLALPASSFGETDPTTGVWKPKKYGGSYGANGFKLDFADPSAATAAAIGKDSSGNGNNWTPNNISVTAGVTYDSMLDVPTMWDDGGNGRGNYCTLNGANNNYGTATLSQCNLYAVLSAPGATEGAAIGTIGMTTGKWYWEVNVVSANTTYGYPCTIGIGNQSSTNGLGTPNASYTYNSKNGNKLSNTGSFVAAAYGASFTATNTIGVAFDADAGTLTFYKNGTSQGTAFTGIASSTWFARVGSNDGCTVAFNFGQRPFAYTPPTGFKALNTQNLPDATIKKGSDYFDVTKYTGNGSTQSIVNSGAMQPDLVWLKQRTGIPYATFNLLFDAVRGVGKWLSSNGTNPEGTIAQSLSALNSNGFTVGADPDGLSNTGWNYSGASQVAWQWKKSASAGFDIVTYTGNGSSRTIAHSLGVAPKMIIVKSRTSGVRNWPVYHQAMNATPTNGTIWLNGTSAFQAPVMWPSQPTSSVFSVSTDPDVNENAQNYVAYCFAEVAGFSKFGSYTGNGSADGPFVYLGFRPKFVMVKRTDAAGYSWTILDSVRDAYNVETRILYPNLSNAENTGSPRADFLSNGFKPRDSSNDNVSGGTYIFAAFAENPFKNSLAR